LIEYPLNIHVDTALVFVNVNNIKNKTMQPFLQIVSRSRPERTAFSDSVERRLRQSLVTYQRRRRKIRRQRTDVCRHQMPNYVHGCSSGKNMFPKINKLNEQKYRIQVSPSPTKNDKCNLFTTKCEMFFCSLDKSF
jgi:hypothetical protein